MAGFKWNGSATVNAFEKLLERLSEYKGKEVEEIDNQIFTSLFWMFEATLYEALEIVDKRLVTLETCPSGRAVFRVKSQFQDRTYFCFVNAIYCSCLSFRQGTIQRQNSVYCKHLLATRIARALDKHKTETFTNDEMSKRLLSYLVK